MSDVNFTFRVDESLKEPFTTAAKTRGVTGVQLMHEFMREFVQQQQQEPAAYNTWFAQEVQAGLDSANAGKLIPHADVEARFAARRAATRSGLDARQKPEGIRASK
jgi:predicted transcriptional regulator